MAWLELFTTDIGLLSLFTIGFVLVMAIYIYGYVKQHMAQDGASAQVPHSH
jgi:hypothetical protein